MDDFSLDCCFNSRYEGLEFRGSTPRYAKPTRYSKSSCDSALCSLARSHQNLRITLRNRNKILKYFRALTSDLMGLNDE
jgi:hypothetical protein